MRFHFSVLSAAFFISATFVPMVASGQNDFIGSDHTVNRVIKLRSTEMAQQAADTIAAETSRIESSARKITNPAQVKFENIENVPTTLRTQQPTLQPRTQQPTLQPRMQQPKMQPKIVQTPGEFVAPPAPAGFKPGNPFPRVSGTWQTPQQTAISNTGPLTPQNFDDVSNESQVEAASNIQTKIQAPKFVNVNQPARMNITLNNEGNSPVANVILVAKLPPHVKLTNSSPTPTSNDGQTYRFSIPQISGQSTRQVEMTLVPSRKEKIDIATVVQVQSTTRTSVAVRQPAISLSLSGPSQANIGQKVTHELIVANVGDGVATDIRLDTVLPSQLKLIKQSSGPFIRSIQPGRTEKIIFESVAQSAGSTQMRAAAEAVGCQPKKTDLEFSVYQPELRVTATGPKLNFVERDGIYTINIENTGVVDVTDTRISLQVPEGMKVNTISRQAGVNSEEGVLTWTFDRIAAKSAQQIQLKATALKEGSQNCNILVSSNETQDKQISLLTQVITRADLSVQIANLTGPVQVGAKAEFLVTVENKGSRRASDIGIEIALPESLMAVKNNDVVQNTGTIRFDESLVAAGQKVTFKFSAVGVTSGEHVVRSVLKAQGSDRKVIAEDTIYVYDVDQTRVSESISPAIPR